MVALEVPFCKLAGKDAHTYGRITHLTIAAP